MYFNKPPPRFAVVKTVFAHLQANMICGSHKPLTQFTEVKTCFQTEPNKCFVVIKTESDNLYKPPPRFALVKTVFYKRLKHFVVVKTDSPTSTRNLYSARKFKRTFLPSSKTLFGDEKELYFNKPPPCFSVVKNDSTNICRLPTRYVMSKRTPSFYKLPPRLEVVKTDSPKICKLRTNFVVIKTESPGFYKPNPCFMVIKIGEPKFLKATYMLCRGENGLSDLL